MSGRGLIPTAPIACPSGAAACAKGEGGLCVSGSRRDAHGVHGSGWLVLVIVRGDAGEFLQLSMTTDEARDQARQLIEVCDVLEGKTW